MQNCDFSRDFTLFMAYNIVSSYQTAYLVEIIDMAESKETQRKGWLIRQSFNNEFVSLMEDLLAKYGDKVFSIQGVANEHMDLASFSKRFFKSAHAATADISIDANANVQGRDVVHYKYECNKAILKLNSLYMLYKWVKKCYTKKDAIEVVEKVINGEIFINDLVNFPISYCYAFDLTNLLAKGMDFFKGGMTINPPKRSSSFIALVIQTTAFISNQIAGACAYPSLFHSLDYLYRKEMGNNYMEDMTKEQEIFIKNQFQNLIYSLCYPYRGAEAPFTNVSIMDMGFLKSLFGDSVYPDMSKPNLDSIMRLSQLFFEYFTEINGKEGMFTFPVTTIAISLDEDGEYIDPEFVKWAAKANCKKSLANIFQSKPTSFSSCCFDGEQKTLSKNSDGINFMTFKQLYALRKRKCNNNFKVFHNGRWVKGKLIKTKNNGIMYNISTVNKKTITVTSDHLLPTLYGNKRADSLTEYDYLLFSNMLTESRNENCEELTYEQGIIIGAFLGDGSFSERTLKTGEKRLWSINLSLNKTKFGILKPLVEKGLADCKINKTLRLSTPHNNVYPCVINGEDIAVFIKKWVKNRYSHERSLNLDCLLQSKNFRRGILDGLYMTDGGNNNRIYTTSVNMVESVEVLLTSLGLCSTIDISDRTNEPVIIRGESFKRNYALYCIRWYHSRNQRSSKNVYIIRNNSIYFKISSVVVHKAHESDVYCFEIKNKEEPYFTLPNGIITHNCRLKNDLTKVADSGYQNSFGVGGVSIGSLRVAGLNLPRMAFLEKEDPDIIDKDIDLLHKILYSHRQLILDRVEKGVLPLYTTKWIDINKQYSTLGFMGAYEYVKNKGEDITSDRGSDMIIAILKKMEDKIVKWQKDEKKEKNVYNIEAIPAEQQAIKLAELDKILGYNKKYKLYSNQYLPLIEDAGIYDRFKIQGRLDNLTSGGSILHLNVDDDKPLTANQFKRIMDFARRTGTVYFAVNYAYSECEVKHYTVGKVEKCHCGKEIVCTYSRVVGFITPTKSWNRVRREWEYPKRVFHTNNRVMNDIKTAKIEEKEVDVAGS